MRLWHFIRSIVSNIVPGNSIQARLFTNLILLMSWNLGYINYLSLQKNILLPVLAKNKCTNVTFMAEVFKIPQTAMPEVQNSEYFMNAESSSNTGRGDFMTKQTETSHTKHLRVHTVLSRIMKLLK